MTSPSEHVFSPISSASVLNYARNFTPLDLPVSPDRNMEGNNNRNFRLDYPTFLYFRPRDNNGRFLTNAVKLITVAQTENEFVQFFTQFFESENIPIGEVTPPREIYRQIVDNQFHRQGLTRENRIYHRDFRFRFPETEDPDENQDSAFTTVTDRLQNGPPVVQTTRRYGNEVGIRVSHHQEAENEHSVSLWRTSIHQDAGQLIHRGSLW